MKGAMLASLRGGRLGQRLRKSGSSALAISTVLQNAVRIVSTMCLTRLLSPDVYGLTGMIMSVFFVITMLSDVGFQAFIVRHRQSDDPDFLSAVWTIHAIRGAGLTLIAILLAWPVSKLLDSPRLLRRWQFPHLPSSSKGRHLCINSALCATAESSAMH